MPWPSLTSSASAPGPAPSSEVCRFTLPCTARPPFLFRLHLSPSDRRPIRSQRRLSAWTDLFASGQNVPGRAFSVRCVESHPRVVASGLVPIHCSQFHFCGLVARVLALQRGFLGVCECCKAMACSSPQCHAGHAARLLLQLFSPAFAPAVACSVKPTRKLHGSGRC